MKKTELDRKERDLRKERKRFRKQTNKKQDVEPKREKITLKIAYDNLVNIFEYDDEEIYNIHRNNDNLVEILLEMQESFTEKDIAATLRKAVRRTGIRQKDNAFKSLYTILE